jgi:hypothetical protein
MITKTDADNAFLDLSDGFATLNKMVQEAEEAAQRESKDRGAIRIAPLAPVTVKVTAMSFNEIVRKISKAKQAIEGWNDEQNKMIAELRKTNRRITAERDELAERLQKAKDRMI